MYTEQGSLNVYFDVHMHVYEYFYIDVKCNLTYMLMSIHTRLCLYMFIGLCMSLSMQTYSCIYV